MACLSPQMVPTGWLMFQPCSACAIWLKPIPRLARRSGFTFTRTAYFCAPMTFTWATPGIMERRWAIVVSAYSSTLFMGRVLEVRVRKKIGESAGFTLRNDGGAGIPGGNNGIAAAMAV